MLLELLGRLDVGECRNKRVDKGAFANTDIAQEQEAERCAGLSGMFSGCYDYMATENGSMMRRYSTAS